MKKIYICFLIVTYASASALLIRYNSAPSLRDKNPTARRPSSTIPIIHNKNFKLEDIERLKKSSDPNSLHLFMLAHLYDITIAHNIRNWDQFKEQVSGHSLKNGNHRPKYDTIWMIEEWLIELRKFPLLNLFYFNGVPGAEILRITEKIYSGYDDWFSYSCE
ncbi:MAG: hypothetical protein O2897_04480 [bacterium]|nr:hypothetical protein [bacterium]